MNPDELAQCRELLGVGPDVTAEELERAFMKRNFALIKGKSGAADEPKPVLEAERARLRAAYEKVAVQVREREWREKDGAGVALGRSKEEHGGVAVAPGGGMAGPLLASKHRGGGAPAPGRALAPGGASDPRVMAKAAGAGSALVERGDGDDEFLLVRFDDWKVNTFVPPLLLALTWLITVSPLGFFLRGFHVWMHEFGHAVPAWLCGYRATPLPFGWTPVEPEYSHFVYWGLLLLFGILFVAGFKERKMWPMVAALAAAGLQYYMTWRMPEHRQEFWWSAFGGVGGEFVLSTLFMMFFWVQLPDKFRWGGCRYVFFFIGATAFTAIWSRWGDIYRGLEEIPFGSMINGEDDQGGDMNKLMDGYGWKKAEIRRNYYLLGQWCWVALGVTWLVFALRLNRVADWVAGKFMKGDPGVS